MDSDPLAPARQAIAGGAWEEALAAATAAEFDDAEGLGAEAERSDLEAEAAWWLGRLDACTEARERAYRLYDEAGDEISAGQCAIWLYEHHGFRARRTIAGAWLRRARRALAEHPDCAAHGALLLREAEMAHGSGDLATARASADRALLLARNLRSADLEAEALQTIGRILLDAGDVPEGMGHLDEAMLFAVEGRLGPYSTGKVYCSLISACEELGDLDRAAEWTEATMRWAQQHPFAIFPGICRVHRAVVLKRRGDLLGAEAEATRACDELAESHLPNTAAAYAEVGDIRRRLGHLDQAEAAFDTAQRLCGRPCAARALLRLAQGRVQAARSIIDDCLRDTTSALARAQLLPVLVHVAIAGGDLEGAGAALAELEDSTATPGTPMLQATVLATRGRLELAEDDPAAAVTLQEAVDRWQAVGVPYEVATTFTLLGQALRDQGDEPGATHAFAAAAERFERIGATADPEHVLDGAKVHLPAGLTAREVEVLQLIAAGLTNNEIAAQLYLSAKTVSRHLSNIFTKIGVNSRAGATAFAFEHDLVRPRA